MEVLQSTSFYSKCKSDSAKSSVKVFHLKFCLIASTTYIKSFLEVTWVPYRSRYTKYARRQSGSTNQALRLTRASARGQTVSEEELIRLHAHLISRYFWLVGLNF